MSGNISDKESSSQTQSSQKKNAQFFLEEYADYKANVASIDTYGAISVEINREIAGISTLMDIGNGGVFDYDAALVEQLIGLDLFLDSLPTDIQLPVNAKMIQGSALSIPYEAELFDGVIMVMLIHHLIGKSVSECLSNVQKAIDEAYRVLRSGGKFIIVESCVPAWFFGFESLVFKPASWAIDKLIKHPATLQYTEERIQKMMGIAGFNKTDVKRISKGKFVLQFGVKVPSVLTPVQPTLFVGYK